MTPPRLIIMGVSGCGKSTVGQRLAQRISVAFLEGDGLHPPRNVALMAAGTPLTDADRAGWLDAIAEHSCSALKRAYRERLRAAAPDVQFVHLHGTRTLLAARLQERLGHYMPAALLDSQLATLEIPSADEAVLTLDIAEPADLLVAHIDHHLQLNHA
jgi:carbohydrate kinase (thermoresistant glucokinase family)